MKKRIYVILIFVIVFIMTFSGKSYGKEIEFNLSDDLLNQWFGNWLVLYTIPISNLSGKIETQEILDELKDCYGYDKKYTKPIRISTTVTVTKVNWGLFGSSYNVKLGSRDLLGGYIKDGPNLSEKALREILGYEDSFGELQEGTSWRVVIDAVMPDSIGKSKVRPVTDNDVLYIYEIKATTLYSGDDIGDKWDTYPESYEELSVDYQGPMVEVADSMEDTLEKVETVGNAVIHTIQDMITDGRPTYLLKGLGTIALDVVKVIIGDIAQTICNFFQSGIRQLNITYKKSALVSDGKHADLAEFVDIENKYDFPDQIVKEISKEDAEKYGFNEDTEIPVITTDLYTLASNKVDLTKANFLVKTGRENVVWTTIRDAIASLIRIIMYIAAAFLVIGLIFYGIQIAVRSFNSPEERKKKMVGLEKFATGLMILVGTLFLEALCLYLSDMILGIYGFNDTYEGPIRVEVSEATGYDFSTTPTGYVRYMADISNIDKLDEKALYVGAYILLSLANLVCTVGMFGRMLIMMGLAIYQFWLVLCIVLKSDTAHTSKFKKWMITYAILSSLQVVVAIIARAMLWGIKDSNI